MEGYGGAEVLRLGEAPEPTAAAGEVVVDIHAASVNPADWKVRQGMRRDTVPVSFPHVLGRDFSGVVREAGAGVGDLAPGDEVFAVTERDREGGYAEAIAIDARLVARKPPALTHVEAAALALTGLTALVALEDDAGLAAGETVLIHGGAGGVGSFAVQYARHVGARVVATASAGNHDYLRGLGADRVDHTRHFMTGDARVLNARPPALFGECVTVADPACKHLDPYRPGAWFRYRPFHDLKRTVGTGDLCNTHRCHTSTSWLPSKARLGCLVLRSG